MNAALPLSKIKELLDNFDCIYFETGCMTLCIATLNNGKRRTVWAYKNRNGDTVYENYKEFVDSKNVDEMAEYVHGEIKDFIVKVSFHGARDVKNIEVPF